MKLICGFLLAASLALPLHADMFTVTISTTGIPANTAGFLALDLTNGDPAQQNTAVITDFATDAVLGTGSSSGDVTGNLTPGPLTLTSSMFFNEWLQGVTYGSTISFNLALSNQYAGNSPDEFSFFLLEANQAPFPTTDSNGSSLFLFDLVGANDLTPSIFTSAFASVTISPVVTTPEPGALPLLAVAGLAGALFLRFRRNPSGLHVAADSHI